MNLLTHDPRMPRHGAGLPYWIDSLNALGIAFVCYDNDIDPSFVSAGAGKLFGKAGDDSNAMEVLRRSVMGLVRECSAGPAGQFHGVTTVAMDRFHVQAEIYALGRRAATGGVLALLQETRSAIATGAPRHDSPFTRLTRREREVAQLIAYGFSAKAIASRLEISTHTARHHTERILTKLGARNRVAVASIIADDRMR